MTAGPCMRWSSMWARTEYSYEIDASSGAIVKAEQELDD